jgi:hypothetical protein
MKVAFRFIVQLLSILLVLILLGASLSKLFLLYEVRINPKIYDKSSIEHHSVNHLPLAYLHIIPGILFLVLGGYQFIPYFRKRYVKTHRFIVKLFLLLSALIMCTAIILGVLVPFGDYFETIVTLVYGSFLLYCTYQAYVMARAKQFIAHQNWVTRIYFIGLSVATIRAVIGILSLIGGYDMQLIFGISFLIAFMLHTFFVELWIRFLRK